jgi:predicted TPR repeat methyltransferase
VSPEHRQSRLESAIAFLRDGDAVQAQPLLDSVLQALPQDADAWHYLGVMQHLRGQHGPAQDSIRHAINLLGGGQASAPMWNNLGNVCLESGQLADAARAYQTCLRLAPASAAPSGAWVNLCTTLRAQGDLAGAAHAARRATDTNADDTEAWYALSRVLIEAGQVHDGLVAHSHAVLHWPRHAVARDQVLRAMALLGLKEDAAALYRQWLDEDPSNPVAQHQWAANAGTDIPHRASDGYVQEVFDAYAPSFDTKLSQLNYQAPQLVARALARHMALEAPLGDVADLGCGTGLCGPLLRPWARRLVGCDLSAKMLAQAGKRGAYDDLVHEELVAFLTRQPQSFDVLAAADTLCYFGELDAFVQAALTALRPQGRLVFTVEAFDVDGASPYVLQTNGRYAHRRSYLEAALDQAGAKPLAVDGAVLRQEAGLPVQGWIVVAARP